MFYLEAVFEIKRVDVESIDDQGRVSNPHGRAVEVDQHPKNKIV